MMVPSADSNLFRDRGDKMAAESASESPLLEIVVLCMLKERRPLLQVGQVIHSPKGYLFEEISVMKERSPFETASPLSSLGLSPLSDIAPRAI
jgi:hypothetical protein